MTATCQTVEVSPWVVAWPGEALTTIVLDARSQRRTPLVLPAAAHAALRRFLTPIPTDNLRERLSDRGYETVLTCLEAGLLVVDADETTRAQAAQNTEEWRGFRLRDLTESHLIPPLRVQERMAEGQVVSIVDGTVGRADIVSIQRWFGQLGFRRLDVDSPGAVEYRHWISAFNPPADYVASVAWMRRVDAVVGSLRDDVHPLRRLHAYATTYGDVGTAHRDSQDRDATTAVLFCNSTWDPQWGGELSFHEQDGTGMFVTPKPGRLVIFPGNLEHRVGALSRLCHAARFSFVLKYAR